MLQVLTLLVLNCAINGMAQNYSFPNQTRPNISHIDDALSELQPVFLRPSINPTPECNLWGPLCQTGTVVVDVDMKSTTAKTIISCSDYLSAQARSLYPGHLGSPDSPYLRSFYSSPECTSYANWFADNNRPALSYSNCPSNLPKPLEDYLPFDYRFPSYPGQYCCGPCAVMIDEIRVLYFADQSLVLCSNKSLQAGTIISDVTSTVTSSLQIDRNGAEFLQTHEYKFATSGGYTFTSPSLYLQIVGTARVKNDCGPVGSVYTDAIVAVPDGDLSTISLEVSIGASFNNWDRGNIPAHTNALKVADLACPTWGLKDSPHGDDYGYTTVGYPFNPIIVPPLQLISLDSSWLKCTSYPNVAWIGDYDGICRSLRNEVFDPPRQLTPVSALLPPAKTASITAASYQNLPSISPAEPAGVRSPHLPANTNKPQIMTSDLNTSKGPGKFFSASPEASPILGKDHTANDKISLEDSGHQLVKSVARDPESYPAEDPPTNTRHPAAGFHPNDPAQHQNTPGTYEIPSPDESPFSEPKVEDGQPTHQMFGQIIYNAFNGISNAPKTFFNPQPATFTIPTSRSAVTAVAGVMATVIDPSVVALAGTMISVGGNPATISDLVFSLLSSNRIAVQVKPGVSHVVALPMLTSSTVTVGDQLVTIINPSAIAMAGTTLSIGGSAKTISSTVFSLNSAGNLVVEPISIDSQKFALPGTTSTTIKIAGQLVTIISPSAIAIAGTTLSIGGSAKAISNTVFSLDSAGDLVVGSINVDLHTFTLPNTASATVSAAGQLITVVNPSMIRVAGTMLSAGGNPITISGTVMSLAPSNKLVIGYSGPTIEGTTVYLSPTISSVFTVDGLTFTPISKTGVVVDGQTLLPGGPEISILDRKISLDTNENLIVNDGRTGPQHISIFPIDRSDIATAMASTTKSADMSSVNSIWPTRTLFNGGSDIASPTAGKTGEAELFLGAQGK
ncbi:hypothetical protein MMC22_000886, partial [Lobaria immixta]|nr:hypothetical protein [Lobaria immixta]